MPTRSSAELAATHTLFEQRLAREGPADPGAAREYLQRWFAPQALGELIAYRELIGEGPIGDLQRIVLSRAARSARLTPHFDLDFPTHPQHGPYWCHKHRRECRPVGEAARFLRRYSADTVRRIRAFQLLAARRRRDGAPRRRAHARLGPQVRRR